MNDLPWRADFFFSPDETLLLQNSCFFLLLINYICINLFDYSPDVGHFNYTPVICKPEDSGDITGLKCHDLTSASSRQCRGTAWLLEFEQGLSHKNIPTVLGIYPGLARTKVNIPAILQLAP